jgi:hypothetical protein
MIFNFDLDDISSAESIAAFNLFVDIAYENGLSLVPKLPILLQCATIQYGPTRVNQVTYQYFCS